MKSLFLTITLAAGFLTAAAQSATFGTPEWTFRSEGRFLHTPALYGTTLLAGSSDHHLYALDTKTGRQQWKFTTGGGIPTEPCIAGNTAIIGSYDGYYYAIDARSGKERWRFKTGGERRNGGKGLWTMQPPDEYMEDPYDFFLSSPAASGNTVFFGSSDSCIYAVDLTSGKLRWKFRTQGMVHGGAAISGNTVIAGSWDTHLYALDATTGKMIWKYKTLEDIVYHGVLTGIQCRPVIADGNVYFGSRDARFRALDLATGALRWTYDGGNAWIPGDAMVKDGRVYIGTSDSYLMLCLDANSGKELHQQKGGGYIFGAPAIAGDLLCYGDFTGRLHLLHPHSFKVLDIFETPGRKTYGSQYLDSTMAINFGHLAAGAPFEHYSTTVAVMDKLYQLGPFTAAPIISGKMIFAAAADGVIYGIPLKR